MKSTISILLILSMIAPFWLSYTILHFHKQSIKKEIKSSLKNGVDRAELTLLKFSNKEAEEKLEWEHSREFEYLNEMYDVIKSETKNDSVFYWCWKDDVETKIKLELNRLAENAVSQNKLNNENLKQLSIFLSSLFYSKLDNDNSGHFNNPLIFSPFYQKNYSSIQTDPLTPPPKVG